MPHCDFRVLELGHWPLWVLMPALHTVKVDYALNAIPTIQVGRHGHA